MRTLRIIRSSTVSAVVLVALALLFTGASVWAVSPGEKGGLIIFTANPTGSSQIYTVNPDGSNMVKITNLPPTKQEGLQPTFSPDGRHILFSYGAGSAGPDLYVVNSDGSRLTQLTFDGLSSAGRWSPDGRRIVFAQTSTLTGVNVIISMRADGKGKKAALTSRFWDSYQPAYSPDGRIVYYSQQGGLLEAVWIMNADGTDKNRLTPASLELFPYDVAPNGQRILMWNHNSTSLPTSIFVMNIDGTDIRQLSHSRGHHDLYPSYSPDGTKVVFASDRLSSNASLDLFTMNADGSDIRRIATGLTVGGCPDQNCVTPIWGPKTTN